MHAFIGPLTPCVGAVSRGTTPAASSFAYRDAKRPYLYPQRAAAAAGGRAARKPQAAPTRMSLASSLVAVQQQQPQQFLLAGEAGGMSVQFPAYLAIFLGTLIPIGFLVILYIQSETRKSAMSQFGGEEEEEEEEELEYE